MCNTSRAETGVFGWVVINSLYNPTNPLECEWYPLTEIAKVASVLAALSANLHQARLHIIVHMRDIYA